MSGRRPDYTVSVSRKNGDKNFYTQIGSAWKVAKDGISIELQALPVADADGKTKCVLFPVQDQ
ncbi:hypothetical protein [Bradyrhizobium sp. AUGA SZCCT0431]|uniref:hypothetical protein n=1 Tax=Bradyrhizobium sp. AUGA SZCCT0431 TaxID=2807674 RepID=UPI001BAC39B8|nr:hypothetical protein [Bradyrhizobium sp. AUGA SZCCT0431]MBR1146692.1 hypothetical protein [Bradyrhizobium sp. AUGA SZCCT0431]